MSTATGDPTIVIWRSLYHFPSIGLWVLLGLLLVLPRANRTPRAWFVLLPVAVLLILNNAAVALFSLPDSSAQEMGFDVTLAAVAMAALFLLGDPLARLRPAVAVLAAAAVALAVGAVEYVGYFGLAPSESVGLGPVIAYCVAVAVWLSALVLARRAAGPSCHFGVFSAWMALWLWIGATLALLACAAYIVAIAESDVLEQLPLIALTMLLAAVAFALLLLGLTLPYLILAAKNTFYRARWLRAFRQEEFGTLRTSILQGDPPRSTEPTAAAVNEQDLVGRWQFYLDELATTVVLDFQPGGSLRQSLISNQEPRTDYESGSWRLEGPLVHLEGYVRARDAARIALTWWMVETAAGLALYGGDGAHEPRYRLLRSLDGKKRV